MGQRVCGASVGQEKELGNSEQDAVRVVLRMELGLCERKRGQKN